MWLKGGVFCVGVVPVDLEILRKTGKGHLSG